MGLIRSPKAEVQPGAERGMGMTLAEFREGPEGLLVQFEKLSGRSFAFSRNSLSRRFQSAAASKS
jgi:hypothetical protein